MTMLSRRAACLGGATLLATTRLARAQPRMQVRLAMLAPSSLLWLHAIARDQGFYERRNLDVADLVAGGSPALVQAVASGSVEAGVSVADLTMLAIDKGAPLVITGAILRKSILQLIGAAGITRLAELAGQPVTAGGVQGGTANLLKYLASRGGVPVRSLRLVAMTNSRDRVVALENGQVKGALLIAPFDSIAEHAGMKVLADYTEDYLQTPLVVNRDWAARNRPAAAALTQAFEEAAGWINQPANRTKAVAILAQYTRVDATLCGESYDFIIGRQKAVPADLAVTDASLRNLLVIDNDVSETQVPLAGFSLARYYDPGFRAA